MLPRALRHATIGGMCAAIFRLELLGSSLRPETPCPLGPRLGIQFGSES